MKEIWKAIKDYEGIYEVSSFGRVKSLDRMIQHPHRLYHQKERILKANVDGGGYLSVGLHKDGTMKRVHVHRLVAMAFVPNVNNKSEVNHIDENKLNNTSSNLEWVSRIENENYGTKRKRCVDNTNYKIIASKNSKKVVQFDLNHNAIKVWNSLAEISRQLGFSSGNISMCCNGKYTKPLYGFYWEFV